MKIEPSNVAGSYCDGVLPATISKEDIIDVLGFPPNIEEDPDKVTNSWGFIVDGEHECGIWDYKGQCIGWSTYGPHEVFKQLFNL